MKPISRLRFARTPCSSTGEYTCTVGRMLNSDSKTDPLSGTGGWTDFAQPDQPWPACAGGAASGPGIRDAICTGNPEPLLLGYGMSTTGGVVDNAFRTDFMDGCWRTEPGHRSRQHRRDGRPGRDTGSAVVTDAAGDRCDHNNPTSCSQVVGAVTVDVVWMMRDNPDASDSTNMTPRPGDTPRRMGDWVCDPGESPEHRQGLLDRLRGALPSLAGAGRLASHCEQDKTIYFKPSCEPHPPAGVTGGENLRNPRQDSGPREVAMGPRLCAAALGLARPGPRRLPGFRGDGCALLRRSASPPLSAAPASPGAVRIVAQINPPSGQHRHAGHLLR